jgi:hypothetical protein
LCPKTSTMLQMHRLGLSLIISPDGGPSRGGGPSRPGGSGGGRGGLRGTKRRGSGGAKDGKSDEPNRTLRSSDVKEHPEKRGRTKGLNEKITSRSRSVGSSEVAMRDQSGE